MKTKYELRDEEGNVICTGTLAKCWKKENALYEKDECLFGSLYITVSSNPMLDKLLVKPTTGIFAQGKDGNCNECSL